MDRRTYLRATAGLAAGLSVTGCLGAGAESGDHDIGMSLRDYLPASFEVAAGDAVVWKNTSSHAHTVTAYADEIPAEAAFFASGGFESEGAARDAWLGESGGALYQGDTYRHVFEVPGTYSYFCVPHEQSGMAATVTVTEGTATATPE